MGDLLCDDSVDNIIVFELVEVMKKMKLISIVMVIIVWFYG